MREIRPSGSEGGGTGTTRFLLPLWNIKGGAGGEGVKNSAGPDLKVCEAGAYEIITQATFAIHDGDWRLKADLRLGVLTALRGVGVPVASAILALADPDRYGD